MIDTGRGVKADGQEKDSKGRPVLYKIWRDKKENVTKIVIDPWAA
jgi:hypothetical protein